MQQLQTTFVKHNPRQATAKQGPNAGNPFTIHEFFTADGTKFDTTKAEVANVAYALLNTPVLVTYEETQNGQYTNRKIQAVQASDGSGTAPGVVPHVGGAPAAPAPTSAPATGGSDNGGTRYPDHPDTARRIARSVGLELAIKAAESGVVSLESVNDLFDVAHTFGAYVFNGSRPGAATGADSSGAGGGGDAGAVPAAPAATETAPAAAQPAGDDDIPF